MNIFTSTVVGALILASACSERDPTPRVPEPTLAPMPREGADNTAINARDKILVTAGRVTLRGPVPTSTERQRVYALVVGIVGGNRVDNQLEGTP